jgi:adenosylmethionine-8-amino-7-oxononanoate aminotransferase
MVTLGKGMTAGAAPAGALVLSRDVVDAVGPRRWLTSGTYRGNPITVAAMSAVQHVIERDGLVARASEVGVGLGADLQASRRATQPSRP